MGKIIAIDTGNSAIKTLNNTFPAGLADAHGIADEVVEYKGRQYAISSRRIPYMRDKTGTEDYIRLALFAIARELLHGKTGTVQLNEDITLAVGLPPAHFRTGRSAFEDYFKSRSPLDFKYNGCRLTIRVDRVLCFPQAYAAAMTHASELMGHDRSFIIDIGGMTIDTLLMRKEPPKKLVPDMSYTNSLDGGVNRLCNDIAAALSAEMGVHAEQDQIEAVLRGKSTLFDNAAKNLIRDMAARFTARLLNDLRERDIDLRTTASVFIGGGSLLLRQHIEGSDMVKAPLFIENTNANAQGYQMLAEKMMAR